MRNETPFFLMLRQRIRELGGLLNAHLHLDRSGTLEQMEIILGGQIDNAEMSSLSLAFKHSLIPAIHASNYYDPPQLRERVDSFLQLMIQAGTTRADTLVDVTADRVGLSALKTLAELRNSYRGTLDFRLGAYSPIGYKDSEPQRWALLLEAIKHADFIGSLPERDDQATYPEHIGFETHCLRMIELAQVNQKPVHIHVDQKNLPYENGAETVLAVLEKSGLSPVPEEQEPLIWLIHVISPSTYDEARFQRLLTEMKRWNLGVICCPSAAISMRQIRPIVTPTTNSIARVLDMLSAGIPVRIGSDNICDITSPAGTADLLDEIFVLCNAIRFYDVDILAKIAAGKVLSREEIARITAHLANDADEVASVVSTYVA